MRAKKKGHCKDFTLNDVKFKPNDLAKEPERLSEEAQFVDSCSDTGEQQTRALRLRSHSLSLGRLSSSQANRHSSCAYVDQILGMQRRR